MKEYPKRSPFSAIDWQGRRPDVQVDGEWYELLAINDFPVEQIMTFAREHHGSRWQKRFEEDLVELLVQLGWEFSETVSLQLCPLAGEALETLPPVVLLKDALMTEANRQALWQARRDRAQALLAEWAEEPLTAADLEEDLLVLEHTLVERYAYLKRLDVDISAYLATIPALANPTRGTFACAVAAFLNEFGDGHTRISATQLELALGPARLPATIIEAEGTHLALATNGMPLDPAFPQLESIDDVPLERWLEQAADIGPGGTPQFTRQIERGNLRYLGALRRRLGLPESPTVRLGLAGATGTRTLELPVQMPAPQSRAERLAERMRLNEMRLLEPNLGYIRLAFMNPDPEFLAELVEAMHEFSDTDGLIIDVRGNGGGSRAVLYTLFPFFMHEDDLPRVVNVAAYRLPPEEEANRREGYLADRFLYPLTYSGWTSFERAEIEGLLLHFTPEWRLPEGEFSAWHFGLISSSGDLARPHDLVRSHEVFHYDRPVVILMDAGCFSATDVFLGAFKGWRDVCLIGTPSGGGSGRARPVRLPMSGLELQLSSMASFQPNGQLYDGRGVSPDILMSPTLSDVLGEGDSVLERAIELLTR